MPKPPATAGADQPGPEGAKDLVIQVARALQAYRIDADPNRGLRNIAVDGCGVVAKQMDLAAALDHVPVPAHQRRPPLDPGRALRGAGHVLGEHLVEQLPLAARNGIRVPVEQIVNFGAIARVLIAHPGILPRHLITVRPHWHLPPANYPPAPDRAAPWRPGIVAAPAGARAR